MEKINYRALASKLFCWIVLGLGAYLFLEYLLEYIVPFIIAWIVAYLIFPLADELSSKIKLSRKICSFLLTFLLLTVILLLLFILGNRLIFEIQNLVAYLTDNSENIAKYFEEIYDFIDSIGEKIPVLNKFQNTELVENIGKNINMFIESIWKSALEKLGSAVPMLAADIVKTLPNILLFSLVTVISCFYFAMDLDILHIKIKKIIPQKIFAFLQMMKARVGRGLKKYIKAYFAIFLITFAELFIGFLVLGVDYSFILAVIIAFLDFLPLIGTGAVLVPWGIILLLMKNYALGIGILVLLGLITVVRQVIEPKIIGKSIGVHPLFTIVALYMGYQLFGFAGMIFLPLSLIILSPENAK